MAVSLDGALIKKAHKKEKYTNEQVNHLLKCSDPIMGPYYFLRNFFYIQHPVKGKLVFEPFDYQVRLVESYHNHRFNVNLLPRQSGKALPLDTKIPTPTGWTTMGELSVGDKILSSTGNITSVTFTTDVMYNHECYEIEFDNGEKIVADRDHLWQVTSSNWQVKNQTRTTKEIKDYLDPLTKKKNRRMWIDVTNPINLPEQDLPIAPYTLGIWLGDGASDGGCYCRSINDNIEMVKFIEQDGYTLSIPRVNSPNSEIRTIYGLRIKLRENNLLKNKHIPQIYLRASINQRLELLRGLMDTDGSVNKEGHCEFYQKNKALILEVRELISSLGIKSRISSKVINNQTYWTLIFTTVKHKVFKLSRKLSRQLLAKGHQKNSRLYIKNIVSVNSIPVKCIQVDDPSHMFLCHETMIPTHNTTTAAGYLLWYAMFNPDVTVLIAAHKYTGAQEIMQRIRYAYELCPDFVRSGVVSYNKGSIEFDNGSRIVSATTTATTGRGMSISLLYCLDGDTTTVRIRNKKTLVEEDITLKDLYNRLYNPKNIIS